MPRITEQAKQRNIERVWLTIKRYAPNGVTESEISDYAGIQRRTLNNYLRDLSEEGKIYKDGLIWLPTDYQETKLLTVDLTPAEAYTLYLGSRLLVKQHDKRNELAEKALLQLADKLVSDEKVGSEIAQAARELARRPADPAYQSIFETMVKSYLNRTPVVIHYKPLNAKETYESTFCTYLIEPSAIGYATYVIGHCSKWDKVLAYKVERIQVAEPQKGQNYRIDKMFPGLDILRNSWSIVMGEKTTRVVLRFSPDVKERVRETQWHPSQSDDHDETKKQEEWLTWWVDVAGTMDLEPWIRSWGADCEVIEPVELREKMKASVKRLMKRYAIQGTPQIQLQDRLLRCWGKTGQHEQDFHPAVFHMLDVAHVAECLLSHSTLRWRNVLSRALNANPDELMNWLPWMIAMHDIGKISVPFQAQNDEQKERLREEGFDFGQWRVKDKLYHTDVGQHYLKNEFTDHKLPRWFERAWREMIGGHHGTFGNKSPGEIKRELHIGIKEPNAWRELRAEANSLFKTLLLHAEPASWPEPENVSTAIMALTGFTILCDWLGSDGRYFKPRPEAEVQIYVQHSKAQAQKAVADAGFLEPVLSNRGTNYQDLFPDRLPARPLQDAINAIPEKLLEKPCLAIIEAPTGEGKTEAALTLAHRIALHTGTDEFYCALPTTATSNQIFKRIQQHLQQRLGVSTQVKLIHGQSFLVEDDLRIEPLNPGDGEEPASLEWFAPKKRALLAPFGVGTIDQAELAALNVRHNALRLIGLAGKTVILDEVHAYDTYMTTIIEQMLRWLSALGSSVILLSATLPKERRQALVRAYGLDERPTSHDSTKCVEENSDNRIDYPRLWIGSKEAVHCDTPQAYNPDRPFRCIPLHIQHDDHSTKAMWLMEQIIAGGNACWISNTVDRAQRLFDALPDTVEKVLIHSQLPLEERQRREKLLDERYGPDGDRPSQSIVIGTQVLEQSLDLDFDLMVSDLAPIDLLLQRMGRLHRHDKNQETRPPSHEHPCLYVNCELDEDETWLKMGKDRFYTEYILQKTWQAIQDKGKIVLPIDYRPLVEAVYGAPKPVSGDPLYNAWEKLEKIEINAQGEANLRLLPDPTPDRPFCANDKIEFVEDEDSAAWIVGQTRLGAESITLIPLERHTTQAKLVPLDEFVELHEEPTREVELRLLRRAIRVSRFEIVQYFKAVPDPSERLFKSSTLLKSVKPLWLENGEIDIVFNGKLLHIRLDEMLGLVIEKGAKN